MDLADRLAVHTQFDALISFAGRTASPRLPNLPYRTGGFGGPEAMGTFLQQGKFSAVIDATHPFAAAITANAVRACGIAHVPLLRLTRAPWKRQPGDDWLNVDDLKAAAAALGPERKTVFLAIGRQGVCHFSGLQHQFVVRSVDPVDPGVLPDNTRWITARGPFTAAEDEELMRREGIDIVVSKNSGGEATYSKIAAARRLKLPVVMIRRPGPAVDGEVHEADAAIDWLEALRSRGHGAPS